MKRSERVKTVVRVREIQEQIAETEALHRRRLAEERRRDVERALADVHARSEHDGGSTLSIDDLSRRHVVLEAAAAVAEDCEQRLDGALTDQAHAQTQWFDAHRRHDAVDRLLDKTITGEEIEDSRRDQRLLDDMVATRHPRAARFREFS